MALRSLSRVPVVSHSRVPVVSQSTRKFL
jgi:hypothetical protein